MLIEALTPLDRTSRIKMYKNNARSSLFCRKTFRWKAEYLGKKTKNKQLTMQAKAIRRVIVTVVIMAAIFVNSLIM